MDSRWTYEDYCRLPNDGKRHEIIAGEHYNHAAPLVRHQMISRRLDRLVGDFIEDKRLGVWLSAPTDVLLGRYDIVQPDKIFIARGNERIITQRYIKGAPDLLVEITSEDDAYDKKTKLRLYRRRSVRHYWIVDAAEDLIYEYVLAGKKYRLVSVRRKGDIFRPRAIRGLKAKVSDVFPP